ncbi:hypothetical protein P7K49_022929 [Saguinus oedipus]|uniref:6-phosphogluconate dehydrogenase NADP-binding domain-containing protein n=1 Tax=Saguinus oedipus TaxID=9490 RepID=A0ABQ9ULQ0_SAGOE|nr:hypothetical protein P7K49_022929 [Saguinus oedipus]
MVPEDQNHGKNDGVKVEELQGMIGFLGLGLMGSGIVSNLLKMGHTVTVWNRTAEKKRNGSHQVLIREIVKGHGLNTRKLKHCTPAWNKGRETKKSQPLNIEGARLGRTPAEVVSTCDITFACVSDPKAAKDRLGAQPGLLAGLLPSFPAYQLDRNQELVLGPSGVLQGIRPGKCYVDMSTVDADTVTELAQVAALLRLALQHPFYPSPRPRLTRVGNLVTLEPKPEREEERQVALGLAYPVLHLQTTGRLNSHGQSLHCSDGHQVLELPAL